MFRTVMLVLDLIIIVFSAIGLISSIVILCLVIVRRRHLPIGASMLLSCNTYPALILGSVCLIDMYGHNFYGDLYINVSLENRWCHIRPYFLLIAFSGIYHSYVLQACFRFVRIVFYRWKRWQERRFICGLIIVQWLVTVLLNFPLILGRHVQYLPDFYHCQIPFTDLQGSIFIALSLYFVPVLIISTLYVCIIRLTTRAARLIRQRDTIVLRRIILLVVLLFALSFPMAMIWSIYLITGSLHPLSYHLQWLTFSTTLLVLPGVAAFLTPKLNPIGNER